MKNKKELKHKTINLTKGKCSIVDSDDFEILDRYSWHLHSRGYACNDKLGLLHRFITNCPKGMVVDHINGNKLDNRKENLRICSQLHNTFNSKGVDNTTSKYKGVSWSKIKNKWKAQIHINKKNTYLGLFSSEIEAAKKYDEIAYSLYGNFAKLNFSRQEKEKEKQLLNPKKELDVGKWYWVHSPKWDDALIFYNGNEDSFGFSHSGEWTDYYNIVCSKTSPANQEDVNRIFIKESINRGLVNGVKINSLIDGDSAELNGDRYFFNPYPLYFNLGSRHIFANGKWATIVEQDKFSELKEAHRNGSVIQSKVVFVDEPSVWEDVHNPTWNPKIEYRIKPQPTFTDKDVAIIERLHDTLLDNQGYSLESKLLKDARMLAGKIKGAI